MINNTEIVNCKTVSILLVEDDEVDAMGIKRAFKIMRILNPLYHARNGVEALEMLRQGTVVKPVIILLDLNMPIMGGLEMLEELRKDPEFTDTVVFVLTTSQDDEDKAAAYKEHIAGYFIKTKLDAEFNPLMDMLDRYWRIVELPTA